MEGIQTDAVNHVMNELSVEYKVNHNTNRIRLGSILDKYAVLGQDVQLLGTFLKDNGRVRTNAMSMNDDYYATATLSGVLEVDSNWFDEQINKINSFFRKNENQFELLSAILEIPNKEIISDLTEVIEKISNYELKTGGENNSEVFIKMTNDAYFRLNTYVE